MTAMGLERTRPQSTQYDDDHDDDVLSEDKGSDLYVNNKEDKVDDKDDGDYCEDNSDNNEKEEGKWKSLSLFFSVSRSLI